MYIQFANLLLEQTQGQPLQRIHRHSFSCERHSPYQRSKRARNGKGYLTSHDFSQSAVNTGRNYTKESRRQGLLPARNRPAAEAQPEASSAGRLPASEPLPPDPPEPANSRAPKNTGTRRPASQKRRKAPRQPAADIPKTALANAQKRQQATRFRANVRHLRAEIRTGCASKS